MKNKFDMKQGLTMFCSYRLQKERAKLYKIVAKSGDVDRVADAKDRLAAIKSELGMIPNAICYYAEFYDRDQQFNNRAMMLDLRSEENRER